MAKPIKFGGGTKTPRPKPVQFDTSFNFGLNAPKKGGGKKKPPAGGGS